MGQPRGLWTHEPNGSDGTDDSDDIDASEWGIGWKRAYLPAPDGVDEANVLRDAWGRELLFFYDEGNDALLVLSRGPDGQYDFGDTGGEYESPAEPVEAFDVNAYDASATVDENNATYNKDNVVIRVDGIDWQPGYFQLPQLIVLNAYVGDGTYGTTKAAFFRAGRRRPGCRYRPAHGHGLDLHRFGR